MCLTDLRLSRLTQSFNSEERVRKGAEKLQKYLNTKQQGRLNDFFKVNKAPSPTKGKGKPEPKSNKRKVSLSI